MGLFSPKYFRCRYCDAIMYFEPNDGVYVCPGCGHRSDDRVIHVEHHIYNEPNYEVEEVELYPPRRRIKTGSERVSDVTGHPFNPVDNWGYFGNKKKKRKK